MPSMPGVRAISAASASGSTSVPPRSENISGLQQPSQRNVQPCTQIANRRPGPSASVSEIFWATRSTTSRILQRQHALGHLHQLQAALGDSALAADQLLGLVEHA